MKLLASSSRTLLDSDCELLRVYCDLLEPVLPLPVGVCPALLKNLWSKCISFTMSLFKHSLCLAAGMCWSVNSKCAAVGLRRKACGAHDGRDFYLERQAVQWPRGVATSSSVAKRCARVENRSFGRPARVFSRSEPVRHCIVTLSGGYSDGVLLKLLSQTVQSLQPLWEPLPLGATC